MVEEKKNGEEESKLILFGVSGGSYPLLWSAAHLLSQAEALLFCRQLFLEVS